MIRHSETPPAKGGSASGGKAPKNLTLEIPACSPRCSSGEAGLPAGFASLRMTLAFAILIRLILMPITLHGDLIFTNYFPYFLSYHGVWDVYGYFQDHYLKLHGYTYYAPLDYYLVGFSQWVLKPFSAGFGGFMEHVHSLTYGGFSPNLADRLAPFSRPDIFRWVFWMKFPYLVADALCLGIVARIYRDRPAIKRKALLLWCFHPVLIFSVYVFGTYRIYPALVLLGIVYLIGRGKKTPACLAFGALLLMDNFPWLLLVPTLLVLGENWRGRFKLLCLVLVPFALVFVPLYVHSEGFVKYAYFSPIFARFAVRSLTRQFAPQVAMAAKGLFIVGYAWILCLLGSGKGWVTPDRARMFIRANAAVLLLFYATSQTPAHYFIWVLPLFVMLQAEGEPWRPWLSWVLVGLLLLFNLDSRQLNLGLFLPVLPSAFSYPSLHEALVQWVPWGKAVVSARLLFSVMGVWMTWKLFHARPSLGSVT